MAIRCPPVVRGTLVACTATDLPGSPSGHEVRRATASAWGAGDPPTTSVNVLAVPVSESASTCRCKRTPANPLVHTTRTESGVVRARGGPSTAQVRTDPATDNKEAPQA